MVRINKQHRAEHSRTLSLGPTEPTTEDLARGKGELRKGQVGGREDTPCRGARGRPPRGTLVPNHRDSGECAGFRTALNQ